MATAPRPAAPAPLAVLAVLALAFTLAWCAFFPFRLTDGDSALFAAMAGEMAADGAGAWLAPEWAHEGARACFHEHPPGITWAAGALGLLGLGDAQAPLAANALWLALLLFSLWVLAGRRLPDGGTGLGFLACGILLLTYPVWKYVVRAGLEIPFAACVTACVAAARSPARAAPFWLGLAFAGALFTRGIFALAVPFILLADTVLSGPRPLAYRARIVVGLLVGSLLAAVYDAGHALAAGHGFWKAYTEIQVLPSLESAGTPHSDAEASPLYYLGRLLLYGLPWWLVAAAALGRRRPAPRALRNVYSALIWVLSFLAGILLVPRRGSRYLFAAWPALAWLTATSLGPWWQRLPERRRRAIAAGVLLLVPALTVGKSLFTARDAWWQAADALRELRAGFAARGAQAPEVYGLFAAHDDRMKQFLRHHLGSMAFRAPEDGALPAGSWRWAGPEDPAYAREDALLRTELFVLLPVPP